MTDGPASEDKGPYALTPNTVELIPTLWAGPGTPSLLDGSPETRRPTSRLSNPASRLSIGPPRDCLTPSRDWLSPPRDFHEPASRPSNARLVTG